MPPPKKGGGIFYERSENVLKKVFVLILTAIFLTSCVAEPKENSKDFFEKQTELVEEENSGTSEEALENNGVSETEETKEENPDTSPKENETEEQTKGENLFNFEKFTDGYYLKIAVPEETFYTLNPILEGRTVDFEKITLMYSLKENYGNLNEKEQFETFLNDYYKNGKLWDMYVASGIGYLATASYGEDEKVGITISMDGKYSVGQIGGIPDYLFPEDDETNEELSEIFGSEEVNARFVYVTPYLNGILISSETKEYIIVREALWDFADIFEKGKIYAIPEVVAEIERLESAIVG